MAELFPIPRRDIVVVGVGTVGSEVARLAMRGAPGAPWRDGRAVLVDFDRVERHNVPKSALYLPEDVGQPKAVAAAAHLARLRHMPVVPMATDVEAIGHGPFRSAAVVFICADTYRGKLHSARMAWRAGVPLVVVGELAPGTLNGRHRAFPTGAGHACLECGWSREYDQLEARASCSSASPAPGPSTRLTAAARIAAGMIETAEERLAGIPPGGGPGHAEEVRIYPTERRFLALRPPRNPTCRFDHAAFDPAHCLLLDPPSRGITVGKALAAASDAWPAARELALWLPATVACGCAHGHAWPCAHPASVEPAGCRCPKCGAPGLPTTLRRILGPSDPAEILALPLVALAPPGDVIAVRGATGRVGWLALPLSAPTHAASEEAPA